MAGWRKSFLTAMAAFTLGLTSTPSDFSLGANDSRSSPDLENVVNDNPKPKELKIDLDGSDTDDDGYYDFVSAKAYVEHDSGADTLNKTKFYNSNPKEDNFLDKVYIENFPGAFKGNYSNYLGRIYANSIESYDFHNPREDGYPLDYRSFTSRKNQEGNTIRDTTKENGLTRGEIERQFGESSLERLQKIKGLADGFTDSDVKSLKKFVGHEVERYSVMK